MEAAGGLLVAIDRIVLAIFVFEMLAKLAVYRLGFFRSGWISSISRSSGSRSFRRLGRLRC